MRVSLVSVIDCAAKRAKGFARFKHRAGYSTGPAQDSGHRVSDDDGDNDLEKCLEETIRSLTRFRLP